jgi:hypothetical protein
MELFFCAAAAAARLSMYTLFLFKEGHMATEIMQKKFSVVALTLLEHGEAVGLWTHWDTGSGRFGDRRLLLLSRSPCTSGHTRSRLPHTHFTRQLHTTSRVTAMPKVPAKILTFMARKN